MNAKELRTLRQAIKAPDQETVSAAWAIIVGLLEEERAEEAEAAALMLMKNGLQKGRYRDAARPVFIKFWDYFYKRESPEVLPALDFDVDPSDLQANRAAMIIAVRRLDDEELASSLMRLIHQHKALLDKYKENK